MLAADRLPKRFGTTPSVPGIRTFPLHRLPQNRTPRCTPAVRPGSPVKTEAMFGGGATKTAKKTQYICKDCGYIYDGRESFESLDKSYRCPVCSSPKRRFTAYNEPVSKGQNNTATRKERKADMQAGGGGLNPAIVIGVGALVVVGAFAYLNTVY